MKKILNLLLVIGIIFIFLSCSSSKSGSDQTKWKYFTIEANASNDPMFNELQDELGLFPHMSTLLLCIDVRKNDSKFLHIGDCSDSTSWKTEWNSIGKKFQDYLLNYIGENKINLEKK
jgi:hypothetical protein